VKSGTDGRVIGTLQSTTPAVPKSVRDQTWFVVAKKSWRLADRKLTLMKPFTGPSFVA
jgi:hypothetical protein